MYQVAEFRKCEQSPTITAALAASELIRSAAREAFHRCGRSMTASDMIGEVATLIHSVEPKWVKTNGVDALYYDGAFNCLFFEIELITLPSLFLLVCIWSWMEEGSMKER